MLFIVVVWLCPQLLSSTPLRFITSTLTPGWDIPRVLVYVYFQRLIEPLTIFLEIPKWAIKCFDNDVECELKFLRNFYRRPLRNSQYARLVVRAIFLFMIFMELCVLLFNVTNSVRLMVTVNKVCNKNIDFVHSVTVRSVTILM